VGQLADGDDDAFGLAAEIGGDGFDGAADAHFRSLVTSQVGLQDIDEICRKRFDNDLQQPDFGAEKIVDGGQVDSGFGGDLAHAGSGETLAGEKPQGSVENGFLAGRCACAFGRSGHGTGIRGHIESCS